MKQKQKQTVVVNITNPRRRRQRRRRPITASNTKQLSIVPEQFRLPERRNLEVGYNLYSKLADQRKEDLDKRGRILDERADLLTLRDADVERRSRDALASLQNYERDIETFSRAKEASDDVRKRNLDMVAEDLELRFRQPTQVILTDPTYFGVGEKGYAEAKSPSSQSPPRTPVGSGATGGADPSAMTKGLSPPGLPNPPSTPTFAEILRGAGGSPPPTRGVLRPPDPPIVSPPRRTFEDAYRSIDNKDHYIRILNDIGEGAIVRKNMNIPTLKRLLEKAVQDRKITVREFQTVIDKTRK